MWNLTVTTALQTIIRVARCSSLFSAALYCSMWISHRELLVHPTPDGFGGTCKHSLPCPHS